jgi:prepilin-type N-terminal cleavage/methylation domain-containing protein
MKSYRDRTGFTLTEILVVVAIIAILTTMVITLAARFETQGKERGMKSALALLDAALGEFRDYGFSYRHQDYSDLEFPLDCNDFLDTQLQEALEKALDLTGKISIGGGTHDPNFSGSEALYFFLSKVPDSRKTLEKIDSSLITSKDKNKQDMTITVDTKVYPFSRIIDPWGQTIRYDYYDEDDLAKIKESKKVFPVITSAGQDGEFGTDDDITNR